MNTPQIHEVLKQGHSIIRIENETQQAMAVIKPRDVKKVVECVIAEMEACPAVAKKLYYSIEYNDEKKTIVEGVSIQGSMAIQRNWKNSASNCRVVEDRATEIICEGVFMDYENNNRVMRQVSVSKLYRPKGKDAYIPVKRIDVAIASGMSKAVRNAVINGVPEYVKVEVLAAAKRIGKCEKKPDGTLQVRPLEDRAQELITDYAEQGVTHEKLKKRLGKNGMNEKDYEHLLGLLNAIQEGFLKPEEVFPDEVEPPTVEEEKKKSKTVKLNEVLEQEGE